MKRILVLVLFVTVAFAADMIKFPVGASTDLNVGTVVKIAGDDAIAACVEGDEPVGVIMAVEVYASAPDSYIVSSAGVVPNVLCGSAITAGDKLVPAAAGAVQPLSSDSDGHIVGFALESGVSGASIKIMVSIAATGGAGDQTDVDVPLTSTGDFAVISGETEVHGALDDLDAAIDALNDNNPSTTPVDWDDLSDVPSGLDDGDDDTWQANTAAQNGYVTAGTGHNNLVWKTNGSGVPDWRVDDDIDGDASSTNELQDLVATTVTGGAKVDISGSASDVDFKGTGYATVSRTGANEITINAAGDGYEANTDNQNLSNSVAGNDVTINISGGSGTTFSRADGDASSTNELQTVAGSGTSAFTLSDGGGTITFAGSGGASVSRSGNTITIDASGAGEDNQTITTGAGVIGAESGTSGDLTIDVGAGWGISTSATQVSVNQSDLDARYLTSFSETDPQVGSNTTNYVPKWDGSALVTGTIYDNGNIGIGTTSPSEKLSVSGRISLTTDPNSADDVGDRGYNDGRYINDGAGEINTTSVFNFTSNTWIDNLDADLLDGHHWSEIPSLPSNNVTGSGAATQVAYWDGTNTITGESNLYWDNSNDRLGIGTSSPGAKLEVNGVIKNNNNIHFGTNAASSSWEVATE
ncbi:hypothetical protein J7L01_03310, partial [bacterium]|nr:hypothetical protein [bacterium]